MYYSKDKKENKIGNSKSTCKNNNQLSDEDIIKFKVSVLLYDCFIEEEVLKHIIDRPFVLDCFKISLYLKKPEKILELLLEKELEKCQTLLFRDTSLTNSVIKEYLNSQMKNNLFYFNLIKDVNLKHSNLLENVEKIIDNININVLPSGVIYLLNMIKSKSNKYGKNEYQTILALLFLRIINPTLLNNNNNNKNNSKKKFRNIVETSKIIQALVNEIINEYYTNNTNNHIKNSNLLNFEQKKLSFLKTKIKNLVNNIPTLQKIEFADYPIDIDTLIIVCNELLKLYNEKEFHYKNDLVKQIMVIKTAIQLYFKNLNS